MVPAGQNEHLRVFFYVLVTFLFVAVFVTGLKYMNAGSRFGV